jgi:1-acyl-sn-glycerol-3-phosphate acyltransferase
VEVANRERIPGTGPILLVANHANSLIDPVMIGIATARPVGFFAKAPLFEVPVFGQVLRALGMLPAHRGMDDPSQVKRNVATLASGSRLLVRGEAVGIFPEGKSHDSLKLALIRSGTARIAMQAVREGARELKIIPLGLNYERKEPFRSAVWVRVGTPIEAASFLAQYASEERQAWRALTTEIERRIKEVAIHLTEENWEPFLDFLEIVFPPPVDANSDPIASLRHRKAVADAINHFLAGDKARAEAVAADLQKHFSAVAQFGLDMHAPVVRLRGTGLAASLLGKAVLLALGFVPALLAALHHVAPFLVVRGIGRLVQMPGKTTISQVRVGLGLPIYAAWYGVVAWWMSGHISPRMALIWALLMPWAGIFSLSFWRLARDTSRAWRQEIRMLFRKAELERLRRTQLELGEKLQAMAEEYQSAERGKGASAERG